MPPHPNSNLSPAYYNTVLSSASNCSPYEINYFNLAIDLFNYSWQYILTSITGDGH
jgi:hypothetical protein